MGRVVEKGESYLRQAVADCQLAEKLRSQRGAGCVFHRCHVALMCQQSTEKSIKGLCLFLGIETARTHDVYRYVAALFRHHAASREPLRRHLSNLFSPRAKDAIKRLGDLVPRGNTDDPEQKCSNLESPFLAGGKWTAPCDAAALPQLDVDGCVKEMRQLLDGVEQIRSIVIRSP